jgi:hypothetical protein
MRRFAITLTLLAAFALSFGCEKAEEAPAATPSPEAAAAAAAELAQSNPVSVVTAIFTAASTGKVDGLAALIDPTDADGDAKRIGEAATDEKVKGEFTKYFAKAKIAGVPKIDGDKAEVPILFGLEGTKAETMNMIKRDGKWYLQSF